MSYLADRLNDQAFLGDEIDLLHHDQEALLRNLDEYIDSALLQEYDDEVDGYFDDRSNMDTMSKARFLFWSCAKPSLEQMMTSLAPLLFICVCQQALVFLIKPSIAQANRLYILTGLAYMLYHYDANQVIYLVSFTTSIYIVYTLLDQTSRRLKFKDAQRSQLVMYLFVLITTVSEILAIFIFQKRFDLIRAIAMILTMKAISFVYYLDVDRRKEKGPGVSLWHEFLNYNGYLWNVSTSVHGPWIDLSQHIQSITQQHISIFPLKTIIVFCKCLICASAALVLSNCVIDAFRENLENNSLLDLYLRALSFRTSNYFICFYTQSLLIINNIRTADSSPQKESPSILSISNPLKIEFPRSLSQVVTNWNLPMHAWLKKYIFVPANRNLGLFQSILLTYFVSSLLHGSNVKIAMVLLSFGFLTYSEYSFRKKLAKLTNCCIAAKDCNSDCDHRRKWKSPLAVSINCFFYALNIYHLIYLGQIFALGDQDDSLGSSVLERAKDDFHRVLNEWSMMGFMSHKINLVLLLLNFAMPN